MSNPTEWPTRVASPTNASACRRPPQGVGAPATSLSVIPCIWLPKIDRPGLTNVDQRSVTLPFLIRTAAISIRSAISAFVPVVSTSSTTNSAPRLDLRGEVEHGAGAGLEERDPLGLADGLLQLELEVDERLEGAVAEQDGLGHHGLGQDLGPGLDHHDRLARAGDDEVEVGLGQLGHRGVDHELAVDPADAHGADRSRGTGSR
jgi:hypothetical protein